MLLAVACVLCVCASVAAQERVISGVVADPTGAKIAQAEVEFEIAGRIVRTRTDESGKFTLMTAAASGTLTVQSAGFNTVTIPLDAQPRDDLQIWLEPATLMERIVVSAGDERIPATPVSQPKSPRSHMNVVGLPAVLLKIATK